VLDADKFSVVGTITGLKRCHGVLVMPELGKGFITDGDAGNVAVFNLKTLKITGRIKTSPDTDSIIYDPASKLVFTFNGDSKNATAIDPVKQTVVKVIPMGGGVEYPVADGRARSSMTTKRKTTWLSSTRVHSKSKRVGPLLPPVSPWAWQWTVSIGGYFPPAVIRNFSS